MYSREEFERDSKGETGDRLASKPWLTMCPDCDHGIRGGSPCETCGGVGTVSVVLAETQRAEGAALVAAVQPEIEALAWCLNRLRQGRPKNQDERDVWTYSVVEAAIKLVARLAGGPPPK